MTSRADRLRAPMGRHPGLHHSTTAPLSGSIRDRRCTHGPGHDTGNAVPESNLKSRVGCRRAVARCADNQARAMAAIAVGERKNAGALIVVRIVLFEWIRSRRLFGVSGAVRDDPKTLISRDAQCIAQYSRDSSAPPQNKRAGRYLSPYFAGAAYPRANLLLGDLQGLETPPLVAAVRQRKNPRSFFAQIYRRPRARPVQVARGGPARWRSWHRCWGYSFPAMPGRWLVTRRVGRRRVP